MSDSSSYSPAGSVCDEPAERPLDKRPAPADANPGANSITEVRETCAIEEYGGGLKPVADNHEQHYNRTNTATFSVFTQLRIDHRTIVRERRGHGTKFCGVELQQQQGAVATNGGMDGDWHEGQRPEAGPESG